MYPSPLTAAPPIVPVIGPHRWSIQDFPVTCSVTPWSTTVPVVASA